MEKQIFNFTDYKVDVEIAGHDFKLDCSSKTGEKIVEASKELGKLTDSIRNGEKSAADAIAYGHDFIDGLLGDGASETIFAGREDLVDDIADLFFWIRNIVATYSREWREKVAGRRDGETAE